MSDSQEVRYTIDFGGGKRGDRTSSSHPQPHGEAADYSIPRIGRLMALAIRFQGLLRDQTIRDYAELARLGGVTRARITQITKLLHLAPDIQEQLLFLPPIQGLNERNLRPILREIDWDEQRRMFHKVTERLQRAADSKLPRSTA